MQNVISNKIIKISKQILQISLTGKLLNKYEMNYLKWNNLIGDKYFNSKNFNKTISLFINEDDLVDIGLKSEELKNFTNEEVLEDFKRAFKIGQIGAKGNIIEKMLYGCRTSKTFYNSGKSVYSCDGIIVKYPPYLASLAGIIIAIVEKRDESRYTRVRNYYYLTSEQFPNMNSTNNWNSVWENIIWWANTFKSGQG